MEETILKPVPGLKGFLCDTDNMVVYKCKNGVIRPLTPIGFYKKLSLYSEGKTCVTTLYRVVYCTEHDIDIRKIPSDFCFSYDGKKVKVCERNSGYKAANIEERKRKLQLVADEALMTKRYFETLKMDEINKHVTDYLYNCLMKYSINTLHMGERTSLEAVPDAIARMYEVIMSGMYLYNYERYCKKLLLNFKKKGSFGLTGKIPKPIKIEVEHLNLERLWERYNVTKLR